MHFSDQIELILPEESHTLRLRHQKCSNGIVMAWRKKDDKWWIGALAQFAFIVAFACAVIPSIREMLVSLGIVALAILGIVAGGLVAFAIYRVSKP